MTYTTYDDLKPFMAESCKKAIERFGPIFKMIQTCQQQTTSNDANAMDMPLKCLKANQPYIRKTKTPQSHFFQTTERAIAKPTVMEPEKPKPKGSCEPAFQKKQGTRCKPMTAEEHFRLKKQQQKAAFRKKLDTSTYQEKLLILSQSSKINSKPKPGRSLEDPFFRVMEACP